MVFAQALSTFVGQNIGAGEIRRIQIGMWRTLLMASGIAIVMTLLIILFKTPLMSMFTTDPTIINLGGDYLTIVTSFYLLFTAMFVINGVMRGAGDTLIPMFITLIALWIIRIPAALFFSKETINIFGSTLKGVGLGESGIWWSIPCGWGAGMVLTIIYYLKGNWKSKGVVEMKVEPATITR
jgi:Na+-driven multidrug efflux pump